MKKKQESEFLFAPVPHEEAVAFIKAKPVVSRDVFIGLLPELKGRAFTITGVESASVQQAVRDRIADLPAGSNWDDIKADVADDISPFLVDPDADPETRDKQIAAANRRAELLLRTHGFQAYQAAQYQVMDRQRDVMPYWQYLTMEDDRVRPSHAALDKVVLPADHEFWQTHFPPWDWGCRCQAVPISRDDYEAIQKEDQERPADQRQALDEQQLGELTRTRRLARGLDKVIDVRAPVERGEASGFRWNPGDLRLPVDQLARRYDKPVWDSFTAWAKQTPIENGTTVWQWLGGDQVAKASPGGSWPELSDLKLVKSLGGSTGAELHKSGDGRLFVLKRGNSPAHLREEALADETYRAAGLRVPASKVYETANGPVKVAEHIDGQSLREFMKSARADVQAAALKELGDGFAADALLGNWDVLGMNWDNILVDKDGHVWRIDNGGSLRFRAQGAAKSSKEWSPFATELWTMRDPKTNSQTATAFQRLDIFSIGRQIENLDKEKILAVMPEEIKPVMAQRIDNLKHVGTKALDMEHDKWKASYADGLTQQVMRMREEGIAKRLPVALTQTPGEVVVQDENGLQWDHLRSQKMLQQTPNILKEDAFAHDILAAVKSLNGHSEKGDFKYNAVTVSQALKGKPALKTLAKGEGEAATMASRYLSFMDEIEKAKAAADKKQAYTIAKFDPYKPKAAEHKPSARSIVEDFADYLKSTGGDIKISSRWMSGHASSSWDDEAAAYKYFLTRQRADTKKEVYWRRGKEKEGKSAYENWVKIHGEEKVIKSLTAWHSLVQEVLAKTDVRGNDRSLRAIRLLRTENRAIMQGVAKADGQKLKRGPNESASLFRPVAVHGSELTVQAVPHSHVTGLYFLEREPGMGTGSFLGDHENEVTFIPQGIPFRYADKLPMDFGSDAATWDLDLKHLRKD